MQLVERNGILHVKQAEPAPVLRRRRRASGATADDEYIKYLRSVDSAGDSLPASQVNELGCAEKNPVNNSAC